MENTDSKKLPKTERLKCYDVNNVFNKSSVGKSKVILVRACANTCGYNRIAPIASKKSGKANVRNKIKRRIRAAYRMSKSTLPQGYDLAFIARYGFLESDFDDIVRSLEHATQRACKGVR